MIIYKFNEELVVRDEEKTMFSLKELKIHEFNEDGFRIIKIIMDSEKGESLYGVLGILHADYGYKIDSQIEKDVKEFLRKLDNLGIITEVDQKILYTNNIFCLREWEEQDADDLYEYSCQEEVSKYAGWSSHKDVNESKTVIKAFKREGDIYAIELLEEKKVIGSVGLHKMGDDFSEKCIGIVIHPKYQRKGVASDVTKEIIKYGFETEKLDKIYGYYFSFNYKMENFAQKQPFVFIGERKLKEDIVERCYVLTKERYQEKNEN